MVLMVLATTNILSSEDDTVLVKEALNFIKNIVLVAWVLFLYYKEPPPSCISWKKSLKDNKSISSGENFCEAASKCWTASNQLIAIGANCFDPSLVTSLFKPLVNLHPEVPAIVYPNNGEKYDVSSKKWLNKEKVQNIEDYIPEWLDLGIAFIGGCCRTNSEDIYNISRKIKGWENKMRKIT